MTSEALDVIDLIHGGTAAAFAKNFFATFVAHSCTEHNMIFSVWLNWLEIRKLENLFTYYWRHRDLCITHSGKLVAEKRKQSLMK